MNGTGAQFLLYLLAVVLLALSGLGIPTGRVSLPLLAGSAALLAYAWPVITT